ncbi:GNAT family N-acetyltransferase [Desertihabitans aurantiacus]|uniref:GNAT family N-acetyltransferase n=1 Tax=Desertihabitans aurantiacus TaxID=2282477 RepID=UPI000DF7F764|nr:GNAT family N-acetyltransferase [Desertihabitans aurantiacus]
MPFAPARFPEDVPTLTRDDVTLRAHRPEDAPRVLEQCTDPLSVRWTTVPLGYTAAMAEDWVRRDVPGQWTSGAAHVFAVECPFPDGTRRFGGSMDVRCIDERRGELAFGAHPAVRGTGVMRTAGELALEHAFTTLGLQSLVWWTEAGNLGSRRLAHDLGFTIAGGVVPRWLAARDTLVDAWVGTLHADQPRPVPPRTVPVLHTPRLVLRAHRRSDDPRVVEACNDQDTRYWLNQLPAPYTAEDAARFRLEHATGLHPDDCTWAVTARGADQLLATVSLMRRPGGHEIGYWAHPDARGRGVVTESVTRLTELALSPDGFDSHRVVIRAAVGNTASQRVAGRSGYTHCGVETGAAVLRDGTRTDHLVFERVR